MRTTRLAKLAVSASLLATTAACGLAAAGPGGSSQTPIFVTTPEGRANLNLTHVDPAAANRVNAPPDAVWEALVQVYGALEVPVDVRSDAERGIGVRTWRTRRIAGQRMSRWVDCGAGVAGPYADSYSITLSLLSQVAAAESGSGSTITTQLRASGRPTGGASGQTLTCLSKGTLEGYIVQAVMERLEAASGGGP
jgi:hypothetical protein